MRDKQELLIGIALAAILAVLIAFNAKIPLVLAANTTNQTNVTVNVLAMTEISVLPRNLTWSATITPGTVGEVKTLLVKNTGSNSINKVYAYADTLTTEATYPINTGDPTYYSSGGVIVVKKNDTPADPGANYDYYHVDRLEWNITHVRPGVQGPAYSVPNNTDSPITWGYYRNATDGGNYLFYVVNGSEINTTAGCNSTNSKFMIETEADIGQADTRNPISGGVVTQTANDWGILNFTSTGPLRGHCVAVHRTCQKILIYRYDRRNSGNTPFDLCDLSNDEQSLRTGVLRPGDEFQLDFDAWIPEGVPGGWLASSWLTIEAGS